jgi:anti-anti-sigma factor
VLLNVLRRLGRRGGRLALVCPTEQVMRPFEISGLVGLLEIFRSRAEAVGALATA